MTIEGVRTRVSTNEVLVTLAVPLEFAQVVSTLMAKVGCQIACAFADVDSASTPSAGIHDVDRGQEPEDLVALKPSRLYGQQAKALKLSGFCLQPDVWKAIGSDAVFLAWIRLQPSAHSKEFSEYINGEGRCEAAHVSRIEYGRGIGHKPDYAAIPLTHAEHALTHAEGESALRPREWFEEQRYKYVGTWAWQALRKRIGVASMADANPAHIYQWANFHGLEKYLPKEYRNGSGIESADEEKPNCV